MISIITYTIFLLNSYNFIFSMAKDMKITFNDMEQALRDNAQESFQKLYQYSLPEEKIKIDKRENTLVHLVLKYGNDDTIKCLEPDLKIFNVNRVDTYGNLPLHIAVKKEKIEFAKKLIPLTNCTIQNYAGLTPLDYAYQYGQEEVALNIVDNALPLLVGLFNKLYEQPKIYKRRLEELHQITLPLSQEEIDEKQRLERALKILDDKEKKEKKERIALLIRCRLFPGSYTPSNQQGASDY